MAMPSAPSLPDLVIGPSDVKFKSSATKEEAGKEETEEAAHDVVVAAIHPMLSASPEKCAAAVATPEVTPVTRPPPAVNRTDKNKFYAAVRGRYGSTIYRDWKSCRAAVMGNSNAKFKRFTTEAAAVTFMRANGVVVVSEEIPISVSSASSSSSSSATAAALIACAPSAVAVALDGYHYTGLMDFYARRIGTLRCPWLVRCAIPAATHVSITLIREMLGDMEALLPQPLLQQPRHFFNTRVAGDDGDDEASNRWLGLIPMAAVADEYLHPASAWAMTFDDESTNGLVITMNHGVWALCRKGGAGDDDVDSAGGGGGGEDVWKRAWMQVLSHRCGVRYDMSSAAAILAKDGVTSTLEQQPPPPQQQYLRLSIGDKFLHQ